jgi:NAD(P)H-nitrite reductase large subunit
MVGRLTLSGESPRGSMFAPIHWTDANASHTRVGGATVCACFGVGRRTIQDAISQGCRDPAALGRRLKAGTNCGSCLPELRRLLAEFAPPTTSSPA